MRQNLMLLTSSTTIDLKEKLDLGNMVELGRNQFTEA